MEQASPAVYGLSSAFGFLVGTRKIFFGRFPLVYERKQVSDLRKRKIGIALIELTPYNNIHIDKWLSTRPVLDAGLLPGIGAERSVE